MKLLPLIVLLSLSGSAIADSVVFDSLSGSGIGDSSNNEDNLTGVSFSLGTGNSQTTLTGIDLGLIFDAAATYKDVVASITFFSMATDVTSGNSPAFLGRLATYNIDLGALTIPEPNTFNYFLLSNGTGSTAGSTPGLVFNQPLTVASGVNLGIQVAYLADSGQGLFATDNLESLLSFGAPPHVGSWTAGSPGTNGFYQNGAKATNGATGTSLLGSDFNVYTNANLGLAMRLYSQPAPEPCTCLLAFGSMLLIARHRTRRTAKMIQA